MDCKVKDEAVRTIVSNLNKMYQNKAGTKVLDAIIGSPTKYGFMQAETHSMDGEGYYDPSTNVSYINDVSNTLTLAEEAFHMYQYVNNQGGPTAVNEVEAKLFSAKMNYEIDDWFSQLRYQNKLAGIGDSPYSKSMESLFYKSYSDEDFKIAVDNFFTGSIGGVVYKNKPGYKRGSIKKNPLIKEFLPAK